MKDIKEVERNLWICRMFDFSITALFIAAFLMRKSEIMCGIAMAGGDALLIARTIYSTKCNVYPQATEKRDKVIALITDGVVIAITLWFILGR